MDAATRNVEKAPAHSGVRAVEVALDILECVAFADGESGVGVSQIASELGIAKGAAFRHLQTLSKRGYILQNAASARYQIGMRAQLLGRRGAPRVNLLTASESLMIALRDTVGVTVVLSACDVEGARVLQTMPGKSTVEIGVRPGSLLPFDTSAQGKVLLAFATKEMLRQIKSKNLSLAKRLAEARVVSSLERDLARARKQGWLESRGEFYREINAVAAPIFGESAQCVGALAVVGLQQFLPSGKSQGTVASLISAADRISQALGYSAVAQQLPLSGNSRRR